MLSSAKVAPTLHMKVRYAPPWLYLPNETLEGHFETAAVTLLLLFVLPIGKVFRSVPVDEADPSDDSEVPTLVPLSFACCE